MEAAAMSAMSDPVVEGVEVRETRRGKFQVEVKVASGTFLADEPDAVGGLGSGPTPYDLIGAALGACTAMTVRLYAERKGWPLEAAEVRVVHRGGEATARDRYAREVVLEGPLTVEQRRRLLEIAERCPVHQTLDRGVDIVTVLAERPTPWRLDPEPSEHASAMERACAD
jgi:putative redox protein